MSAQAGVYSRATFMGRPPERRVMATWSGRVDDLLFEGEAVRESVPVGDGRVVVTSHRLLAFTPGTDGENYRHVDLPNVEGVTVRSAGETGYLEPGAKAAVVGVVLMAAGATVSFDGLLTSVAVDPSAAAGSGIGGVLGLLDTLTTVLGLLDDAMLVAGALGTVVGLGALGLYLQSRERLLEVEVAGDEPVRLPVEGEGEAAREALALALGP